MKHRIYAVAAVLALLLSGLTACGTLSPAPLQKFSTHSFDYFDTVTTVTGYAQSQEAFDRVAEQVLEQLQEYHLLYDIYKRYDGMENLCTVNDLVNGAHRTVTVDRRIIDLLLYAREMYDLTDGMTNIAMGSVLKLWHDCRTDGIDDPAHAVLPDAGDLSAAAANTDLSRMVIDEEQNTVTLTDPRMRLDVGAIAKGYATERVAQWMEQQGITGYVLNVGGNVRAVGNRGDGTPWAVGIEQPDGSEGYVATLNLTNEALVTSGSYQRYYIVDGKRYHHIIHPDTRMPADRFTAVSVVCNDAGLGDALSTALFCMTLEEGQALINSIPGAAAHWVAVDGTRTASRQWSQYVKT
ncbi:MAG: FAD:protein FMN transferase [Clostridia bacterium]|nr:FAD:protein FMN transferase [Clostridia bacterium]